MRCSASPADTPASWHFLADAIHQRLMPSCGGGSIFNWLIRLVNKVDFPVACFAKPDQLKKRLIIKVRISRRCVVNVFNRFLHTPLANSILPLKYSIALSLPLFASQISKILFVVIRLLYRRSVLLLHSVE